MCLKITNTYRTSLNSLLYSLFCLTVIAGLSHQANAIVNGTNDIDSPISNSVVLVSGTRGCTGTLITPRIVVTAGHCFNNLLQFPFPSLNLPSLDGGGNVLSNKEWYPYFVNPGNGLRISFGNTTTEQTIFRAKHYRPGGYADIVLLGLDGPVPPSIAVPTPVLTELPEDARPFFFMPANFFNGEPLEIVGWGGIDLCAPTQFPNTRQSANARFVSYPISNLFPNQLSISGLNGSYAAAGDSGGPLFINIDQDRHLIGVNRQCTSDPGPNNYYATWSRGGVDSDDNQRPNLSAWFENALKPGWDQWSLIGNQTPVGAKDIAVCNEGTFHALSQNNELMASSNLGTGNWQIITTLPNDAIKITCAKNSIYFQKGNREVWRVNNDTSLVKVGNPHSAQALAGTQDSALDFPFMWALNDDKSLWFNNSAVNDTTWQRMGQPTDAKEIAAISSTEILALNNNGSLWINKNNGDDSSWKRLLDSPSSTIDIASAIIGPSDLIVVFAVTSDGKIFQSGYMQGGGQIPAVVDAGDIHDFTRPMYSEKRLDWCYQFGNMCDGNTTADAFCKLKGYDESIDFSIARDIGSVESTYVLGAGRICSESSCDGFSKITCKKN